MPGGARGRPRLGLLCQVAGLVLLPAAVWYGVSHEDVYSEIVLAAMGVAFLMIGRHLRAGGA